MKLTPKDITDNKSFYSIPIYQRLFEWDTENIVILLNDLKKAFDLSDGKDDYYVGMLTSTEGNELVDGQQRFTVMMLMGCVLKDVGEWKRFISDGKPRLRFTSRPLDDAYLQALIDDLPSKKSDFVNAKMKNGIEQITSFFLQIPQLEKELFASYIFNHLSFFISYLPEKYSPTDLNKYFERMNTTGKNLEQHEILKVKLLSNLSENVSLYMQLWNKLSDVDTLLMRKRNGESEQEFSDRKCRSFQINILEMVGEGLLNGMGHDEAENDCSIGSIAPSATLPSSDRVYDRDSRCSLTFPYILLQTLYWKLGGKINGSIADFFNPSNLLDTFSGYLPYEGDAVSEDDILDFVESLVKCRLTLDICFVRPTEFGYSLDMNLPEENEELRELMMFESMLYVSSSNYTHYKWFGWLMNSIMAHKCVPGAKELYAELKKHDDDEHRQMPAYDELSFGEIRYWFWRLDFYLWKNRKAIFENCPDALNVAENYVFKRNRSIEHIAPQTPLSDSELKWEDSDEDIKLRDSFGNLVMISQGLNSSLSNDSYQMKTAYVQAYCSGDKSGSIESLKLLVVHKDYKAWDKKTIVQHGYQMYDFLLKSFD